jgi:drug/metabolite transporter (DMT)-like permease
VEGHRGPIGNPYLLLALTSLFWSGNHIVGRAIASHVPPLAISTLRWLLPALVLGVLARDHLRKDWPAIRAHWRTMLLLGITGGTIFTAGQYIGLQYTTALNVSVLNSLAPVFMLVAAAILFRDFMSPRQLFGVAVSLAGVLVIITRGEFAALAQFRFNAGDIIIVANMAVWAIYAACLRMKPTIHWTSFLLVFAAVSAVFTLPFWAWEAAQGIVFHWTWLTLFSVLYVATFPSMIAFAMWNRGAELIGSNRAGPFLHLIPVYSAVLAVVLLGETLGLFHVVGFALILAGVWLAARRA